MDRWKLLVCALFGHDRRRTRVVYARLEIPGADRFIAAICFRCGHIREDLNATPTLYQPCPNHLEVLDTA